MTDNKWDFFFFDNNFWNASIIALAQTARWSIHSLSKALHVSVYVYISVYWYKLCVLVNRERQRKNQTDRRRQRFPEDRSQGTWSLPVYYLGLSCLQTPHMCREFDRAQYWFHTASEVSISWSQMNSVFTSCRTGSFCTQRDLNVCSLTYEAEGKRAVKVLIRLWRAEVVLLFFQIKGI